MTQPFLTGHGFHLVFLLFLLACVVGTFWEELLLLVLHHRRESRTGTVIGPFSPIYGYGAAVFAIILGPFNDRLVWWQLYLPACLVGGVMEFTMSLVAEKVFHEVIWDYHDRPLNIMGRTTLIFMLGWGLGGLALMKLVYPLLIAVFSRVPFAVGEPVFWALVVFMAVNLFLTYGALLRQSNRVKGLPPSALGRFFDKHYPQAWLKKRFPAIDLGEEKK